MSIHPRGGWFFEPDARTPEHLRHDRIELRSVRHLVERHQDSLNLPNGLAVALRWQAHSGGTFGPMSSAAANHRQRTGRSAPPAPLLDRGKAVACRCYFRCPRCDRSCLVLCNPLWRWRPIISEETIGDSWCCQPCGKYRWPSDRWTGTSRATGRRPPSYWYESHHHAANRIEALMEEPRWLTVDRWVALGRLREAHLTLAAAAAAAAAPVLSVGITPDRAERARRTIVECKWATRQRSWARLGAPRPGPEVRERLRAAQAIPPRDCSHPIDRLSKDALTVAWRGQRGGLQHVVVEHVDQWIRRPATLLARFGVMGLDQLKQCLPGHHPSISE